MQLYYFPKLFSPNQPACGLYLEIDLNNENTIKQIAERCRLAVRRGVGHVN